MSAAEASAALYSLHHAFEDLVVRGLESSGPDDVRRLEAIGDDLARAGASYVAGVIGEVVHRVRESDRGAARALLRAQTATRVFERVLSLDTAAEVFGGATAATGTVESRAIAPIASSGSAGARSDAERRGVEIDAKALVPVLEELASTIEGLVATGMTTASAATKAKLDATFKEASRLKLLRLAASLRYVGDECARFLADSPQFSPRRLAFFLNRTWLISRGLLDAIARDDRAALARLLWQATPTPANKLTLAVLGVHKRALLDGSAAFEFRMRVLSGDAPEGTRLVWSCMFGAKPNVPAEAFLHLPQTQKFTPKILLEATEISVTGAAVTLDEHGGGRLMLGPKATVKPAAKLTSWQRWHAWEPATAAARIRAHPISPLDLEVELQEEVVLTDWELGAPAESEHRPEHLIYPLTSGGRSYDAIASRGGDGEALRAALDGMSRPKKTKARPPLFGLVHYEMARLVFQPLTAFGDKPSHLMISTENIDLASLMKTLDFTS